ncbi:kinetochore-associated protein DSN1 homolog isoform X1 [Chiloscyllium punctatum]|uniref:kinetochore-associated protein DSN1 homolog isoform X1 n=1 Tax=Chiloscyllium punctatum TaxID=137246 RepID=UPI003B63F57F
MAEGSHIKTRLRSSNQTTPLSDQSSSSKRKYRRNQKSGNSESITKQEGAPQRSSFQSRRSPRLNPGVCADTNLISPGHTSVSPNSQGRMTLVNPTGETEVSKPPSPNKRLKKSPKSRSLSWRRSSFKGGKGRKSLPPIHHDATEIFESISTDLPEDERLALLFHACLEYTLQKLQRSSEAQEAFSLEAFQNHASDISNNIKRIIETMKLDGTLRQCTEKPDDVLLNSETEMLMKQLKDGISRLNVECKAWDQLLEVYRQKAEHAADDLEKAKVAGGAFEPITLENSQINVIRTRPDYQSFLDEDVSVLQNMECIMDQLQLTMNLITRAKQEWDSCLKNISEELASRTFKGLEECPVQKFLTATKEK